MLLEQKKLHEKEHILVWLVSYYCTHIAPEKNTCKTKQEASTNQLLHTCHTAMGN
jgi:hypothetical protein